MTPAKDYKIYYWTCPYTESGALEVLARDVRHARTLVREHFQNKPHCAEVTEIIKGKPSTFTGPGVINY